MGRDSYPGRATRSIVHVRECRDAVMGKDAVTGGGKAQETWMKFDAINFDLARERQVLEAQYVQAEQQGNKKQMERLIVHSRRF